MIDQAVLVTAASRGIGSGIATRLTADGFAVVNLDRVEPAALLSGETFLRVDLAVEAAAPLAEVVERHVPARDRQRGFYPPSSTPK